MEIQKLHNKDFNSPSQSIWHLKSQQKAHIKLQFEKVGPPKTAAVHSIIPLRIQAQISSQSP